MRRPTTPYGWSLVIAVPVGVGLALGFAVYGCWALAAWSAAGTVAAAYAQNRVIP